MSTGHGTTTGSPSSVRRRWHGDLRGHRCHFVSLFTLIEIATQNGLGCIGFIVSEEVACDFRSWIKVESPGVCTRSGEEDPSVDVPRPPVVWSLRSRPKQ